MGGCINSRPVDPTHRDQNRRSQQAQGHGPQQNHNSNQQQAAGGMGNRGSRASRTQSTPRAASSSGAAGAAATGAMTASGGRAWAHPDGPVTRAQLERMRDEFWHTRTENRAEVWQTLRVALEAPDHATRLLILESAGIIVRNGNLSAVYDSLGAKYDLPPLVLSDPTNLVQSAVETAGGPDDAAPAAAAAGAATPTAGAAAAAPSATGGESAAAQDSAVALPELAADAFDLTVLYQADRIKVKCNGSDTVAQFKTRLLQTYERPETVPQVRLFIAGKELTRNNAALSAYGVGGPAFLHLAFRPLA